MAYQRWRIIVINALTDKHVFWLCCEVLTCLYENVQCEACAKQVPVALKVTQHQIPVCEVCRFVEASSSRYLCRRLRASYLRTRISGVTELRYFLKKFSFCR